MNPSPMDSRTWSTMPWGTSMSWKTTPAMISAMTYGAKKSSRSTARPGKSRLSSSARPSAKGIWTSRERTMISALCVTAPWKTGSDSAFW